MTTKHCFRGSWDGRLIPLLHNLFASKRRTWMIAYDIACFKLPENLIIYPVPLKREEQRSS